MAVLRNVVCGADQAPAGLSADLAALSATFRPRPPPTMRTKATAFPAFSGSWQATGPHTPRAPPPLPAPPPRPMPPAAPLWRLVPTPVRRAGDGLEAPLQRGHGLGLAAHRALPHRDAAERSELPMQGLADRAGLNQTSVTRLAARLEKAGFTCRDL